MKKRLIVISLFAAGMAFLIWAIPVAIGSARAKPLQGSFLVAGCACGHEIFYLIEHEHAYDYCPGHKEKKLIGPVSRNGNLISVFRARDSVPDFDLKFEKGNHYLKFLSIKDHEWNKIDQITNPWRTLLRSYFPE